MEATSCIFSRETDWNTFYIGNNDGVFDYSAEVPFPSIMGTKYCLAADANQLLFDLDELRVVFSFCSDQSCTCYNNDELNITDGDEVIDLSEVISSINTTGLGNDKRRRSTNDQPPPKEEKAREEQERERKTNRKAPHVQRFHKQKQRLNKALRAWNAKKGNDTKENIRNLPSIMPVTFPCCCRPTNIQNVSTSSLECMCRDVPECAASGDTGAEKLTTIVYNIQSAILGVVKGALGILFNMDLPVEDDYYNSVLAQYQNRKRDEVEAKKVVILINDRSGDFKSCVALLQKGKTVNDTGIIDESDGGILGLTESDSTMCPCEIWTSTELTTLGYIQLSDDALQVFEG